MSGPPSVDRCLRAITNDGGFRLIAVTLRETVSEAARAQSIAQPVSEKLAELMVGSVLLRETTSPSRRVQIALRETNGAKLIADSLASGLTRGLVNPGSEVAQDSDLKRALEVTYTQANGALHKGIVAISEDTDISAAMMTYLQESEQILTTISVAAKAIDSGRKIGATGFVVQLLPELERSQLATMTARLEAENLAAQMVAGLPTPASLIARIFDGFDYTLLADSEVRFGCNCSRERFLAGIGTLPAAEIQSMLDAGEPLELRCDACGKGYEIAVDELRGL